jgi:hypothetical protein
MKRSTIAFSLIAMFLAVGCSDNGKDQAAATAAATATPAASAAPEGQVSPLTKELPAAIKNFAFETAGNCSIDVVNNAMLGSAPEVTVNRTDGFSADGWAFDEKSGSVPAVVTLQLVQGEERYYAQLNRHGGRDDLSKAFGKPEFANAGYFASVEVASLPAGQYAIFVVQKGDGKNMVCSTNRKLNLKG